MVRVAGREVAGVVEDGRLRLVVRGLEPGRYRVRVAYLGTSRIEARERRRPGAGPTRLTGRFRPSG